MGIDSNGTDVVGDHVNDVVAEVRPRLRGWLHVATSPLTFLSMLVLLVLADTARARSGVAVFMVSALLLFTTSAIYHTGTWSPQRQRALKRLDHATIFVLIAGSSTPFALLLLPQDHSVVLMGLMWGGAALGVLLKVFWIGAPRWLNVPMYLVLGWAPVFFADEFLSAGQGVALLLAGLGGVLYSLGALVYGVRRPDPSPAYFGFHEVFHALTIAAFAVHYAGVAVIILG